MPPDQHSWIFCARRPAAPSRVVELYEEFSKKSVRGAGRASVKRNIGAQDH